MASLEHKRFIAATASFMGKHLAAAASFMATYLAAADTWQVAADPSQVDRKQRSLTFEEAFNQWVNLMEQRIWQPTSREAPLVDFPTIWFLQAKFLYQ